MNIRFGVLVLVVLAAAFSRILPHAPNLTPIGALALFGAAYFNRKAIAFLIPALAVFLSSLVINNLLTKTEGFVWFDYNYIYQILGFALVSLLGMNTLKKVGVRSVLFSAVTASLVFFVVSNFGTWMSSGMYSRDMEGLVMCYTAAIPLFWNTLAGDLIYCTILFGGFELARRQYPVLAA